MNTHLLASNRPCPVSLSSISFSSETDTVNTIYYSHLRRGRRVVSTFTFTMCAYNNNDVLYFQQTVLPLRG